jgi:hypothetical protein
MGEQTDADHRVEKADIRDVRFRKRGQPALPSNFKFKVL